VQYIRTTISQTTPIQITGVPNVKTFVLGSSTTFAILNDGSVKSTGNNNNGQLGLNNKTNQKTFQNVLTVSNITSIASYNESTYFVTGTGDFYVTGAYWYSSTNGIATTSPVLKGSGANGDVRLISTSGNQTYSLTNEGKVFAWGQTGTRAELLVE